MVPLRHGQAAKVGGFRRRSRCRHEPPRARAIDGSVISAGSKMSNTRRVDASNSARRAGVDSSSPAWMLIQARGRKPSASGIQSHCISRERS